MASFLAKGSSMVCNSLGRKEGKASAATTRGEEILALHLSGKRNAAEEPMDTEKNMLVGRSKEEEDEAVSFLMLCYSHSVTVSDMQNLFVEWLKS